MHQKVVHNPDVCSMGCPDALRSVYCSSTFSLLICDNLVQQWMPLCQTVPLHAGDAGMAAGAGPASYRAVDTNMFR